MEPVASGCEVTPQGWRNDDAPLLQAASALQPVLVAGMKLGCISHARLSARPIAADGARLVGWIANGIDLAMDRCDEVFALLRGRLPFAAPPDAEGLATDLVIPGPVAARNA